VFAVHRLTSLTALAFVAACSAPPTEQRPAAPVPAASSLEPVPKDSPGVQADGEVVSAVQWFEGSFDEAQAAAKAGGKRLFVDVGAYWCPPCRKLDEEVFTQKEVGVALARDYVAVHVDAEKGEGPELVARYRVQAYPTLLVLEAGGLEQGRMVDAMAPAELLATLGQPMWIIDHIEGRLAASSAAELALWCDNWEAVAEARGFMNILVGPAD